MKRYWNTQTFPNHDNKKFIFMLEKRFDQYEYMDDWKKSNKTSLSKT